MKIVVKLDEMMAKRKIRLNELAQKVGITESNLSILKTGKAKANDSQHWKQFVRSWDVSPAIYLVLVKILCRVIYYTFFTGALMKKIILSFCLLLSCSVGAGQVNYKIFFLKVKQKQIMIS